MKVSVKTGDTVLVNSGKDSGKKGKVLAVIKEDNRARVVVEGVNIVTKAKKARSAQDKSEFVKKEAAIDVSNVNVVCPSCGKAVRVAHKVDADKKIRVCSKCGAGLDAKFVKDVKAKKAEKPVKEEKSAEKSATAEKPAKTEQKSKVTKSVKTDEKATKVAVAKKPQTSRSAQRGV